MRVLTVCALGLITTSAMAEDFLIRADVTEVTLFGGAAEVTRPVEVDLPEGDHLVLVALPNGGRYEPEGLRVLTPDGEIFGTATVIFDYPVAQGELDSDAQQQLFAQYDMLLDRQAEIEAAITEAGADISVFELQRSFLEQVARDGLSEIGDGSGPGQIGEMLQVLAAEMGPVSQEILDLEQGIEALTEELAEVVADIEAAERNYENSLPLHPWITAVAVPVSLDAPSSVQFDVVYVLDDGAEWGGRAMASLSSEDAVLRLDRTAIAMQWTSEHWLDVALTMSTQDTTRRRGLGYIPPGRVRIQEIVPEPPASELGGLAEPILEPVVIVEDSGGNIGFEADGLSYISTLPGTHDLISETLLQVPLAPLEFDVELAYEAYPRRDGTAVLMVRGENDLGEPLILSDVQYFRDGSYLDSGGEGVIPPGGRFEMAFGPVDHLTTFRRNLSQNEGDQGVMRRSETRNFVVEFGAENLSDREEDLRLLYSTPFAEQEDLELDVRYSRLPDVMDVDSRRGLAAWDLTLAPGEVVTIRMEVDLTWPEGYELRWRP